MSETKFTKGDWQVWGDWAIKDCTHAENLIATFEDGNIHNARLIAAAPEMYKLLERLTNQGNCKKDIIHLLGEADSLLAKARG